jgi:hypothetical protein
MKPRKIASVTFELWCNIEDIPSAARHEYLKNEIYHRVMNGLVRQCAYTASDLEDSDDIADFRDIRQVLQYSLNVFHHLAIYLCHREFKKSSFHVIQVIN